MLEDVTRARPLALVALLHVSALAPPLALVATSCAQPVDEQTVALRIEGMVCTSCEQGIGHALEKLDGVLAQTVDHEAGRAEVQIDANKVTPAQLVETVNALGYTAHVAE